MDGDPHMLRLQYLCQISGVFVNGSHNGLQSSHPGFFRTTNLVYNRIKIRRVATVRQMLCVKTFHFANDIGSTKLG